MFSVVTRFNFAHWDIVMLDAIVVWWFPLSHALLPFVFYQGNNGSTVSMLRVVHQAFSGCYGGRP
jgi:hypothetical protein